jgi:copper(I)-binding protein
LGFLAVALGAAGAAACSGTPRIRIDEPEARLAAAFPGTCSIFMKIANPGDGDDALLDAAVDLPGAVTQVHAFRDGRMVQSGKLVVPSRGVLELRPGGAHIMVFNLPSGSAAGDELTLRLRFERSGEKRTSVRIRG